MLIYYVRHGDPCYNPDSLTPLGKRQAEAVGRRVAMHGIDRIFASSSNRAIETAIPLSEITKREIEILDFANEGHAWEEFSMRREEDGIQTWAVFCPKVKLLFASPEMQFLGDNWFDHPAIKDTKMPQGVRRINESVDAWLLSLGYEHDRMTHSYRKVGNSPSRIALFAHGGFSWAFMSSLLDIPYPVYATHFNIEHSGVTVIELADDPSHPVIPMVLQISSDAHLIESGLPTRYSGGTFI